MLWKGVNPYEYIDNWEKFEETLLLEKEDFYSHLNMEDITDADYTHGKEFAKVLKYVIYENIIIYMFRAIHFC